LIHPSSCRAAIRRRLPPCNLEKGLRDGGFAKKGEGCSRDESEAQVRLAQTPINLRRK
jgi:hypothetical protein